MIIYNYLSLSYKKEVPSLFISFCKWSVFKNMLLFCFYTNLQLIKLV